MESRLPWFEVAGNVVCEGVSADERCCLVCVVGLGLARLFMSGKCFYIVCILY